MDSTPTPNLDSTLGAVQIGVYLLVFLFGVLTLQLYYYYEHHSGDGPFVKGFTAATWFLELLHTITALHYSYYLTVTNFGQPTEKLAQNVWSFDMLFILCGASDVIVQGFYALRVARLSRRYEIAALSFFLAVVQFVMIIILTASISRSGIMRSLAERRKLLTAAATIRAFSFLIVPLTVCYYLLKSENIMSLGIRRVALLLIETGFITAMLAIATFATEIWDPQNYTWVALALVGTKVESNSLLTSLNSRHLWKSGLPLVEIGKKTFYNTTSSAGINRPGVFDIRVEKTDETSSTPASISDRAIGLQRIPL